MELNSIVYNILNIYRGGRSTNNEHVTPRQIKSWVNYYRALYIRRDETRNRRLREFEQSVVLPIETVEQRDDNWPRLARTEDKLPKLLRFKDNEAVTYVGDERELQPIQVVDNHSVYWRQHNKYTPNNADSFYNPVAFVRQDNHLYVRGVEDDLDELTIRAVYENPETFQEFLIDLGKADSDDAWDYPLPEDLIESIIKQILEVELQLATTTPLDIVSDNIPDHQTAQPAQE